MPMGNLERNRAYSREVEEIVDNMSLMDDDLGRMLADFRRKETRGFNYPELENGVRHFKEDKEGRNIMCEAVEKYGSKQYDSGKDAGRLEGKLEGKLEGRLDSIRALMKNLKMTAEQAMESIGIPKSEYQKYLNML